MSKSNMVLQSEIEAGDWLSEFMDGELSDEAGLDALVELARDAGARQRWSEYALIGDALRGHAVTPSRAMTRFSAALAQEPTVLAPMPRKRERPSPVLWLAAAATVAGVTWGIVAMAPEQDAAIPVAVAPASDGLADSAQMVPYLVAHQDYAHAVLATPEMNITQVSLSEVGR